MKKYYFAGPLLIVLIIFNSLTIHLHAAEEESDTLLDTDYSGRVDTEFSGEKNEIFVNIPSFKLELRNKGRVIASYPVRVGKLEKKTKTGRGYITKKFNPAYFRYTEGEKAGEIIEYSSIRETFNGKIVKTIKIPYEKIRGLELCINREISGQIIHSTTNPETLGQACSGGCIGLAIEDMLELYSKVSVHTPVTIVYETLTFADGVLTAYPDIYGYENPLDFSKKVEKLLLENGINLSKAELEFVTFNARNGKTIKFDRPLFTSTNIEQDN